MCSVVAHPYAGTMNASTERRLPSFAMVLWLVLVAAAVVQAGLVLHELGHALAALAMGGSVTGIDALVWSSRPHASYHFDGVSDTQRAFVIAAGTLLPLVAWALVVLALPRRMGPAGTIVRLIASAGVFGSVLPWLVLPWPGMHASAPTDDVVRFTLVSGWPPALVVTLTAALVGAGALLLYGRLGGRDGLRAELGVLRRVSSMVIAWRTILATALVLLVSIGIALALHALVGDGPTAATRPLPLPSHPPIADVHLDDRPFEGDIGGGVAGEPPLHLVLGFDQVEGGPFRIGLIDAEQREHALASFAADTTMGVASSRPRVALPPGPWRVHLWAQDTVGWFRVWVVDGAPPGAP